MVGGISGKDNGDANDAAQHVGNRPPSIFRVLLLDICDDRGQECYEPCQLHTVREDRQSPTW